MSACKISNNGQLPGENKIISSEALKKLGD